MGDWETSEKHDEYSIIRAISSGTMFVPSVVDNAWLKKYLKHFSTTDAIWNLVKEKVKDKEWTLLIYDIFLDGGESVDGFPVELSDNEKTNFLELFKKNFSDRYAVLHDMKISTGDYNSYMQLCKRAVSSEKCLSDLNLNNEIKGKIFVSISTKSDVCKLYQNVYVTARKDKFDKHVKTVSALIETAEIVEKEKVKGKGKTKEKPVDEGHRVRAFEHGKKYVHVDTVRKPDGTYEKVTSIKTHTFKFDKKILGNMTIQDSSDLCTPPKNSGWSKGSIMKLIESKKKKICDSLISDGLMSPADLSDRALYDIISANILKHGEYINLLSEVKTANGNLLPEYGNTREAFSPKTEFTLDQWQIDFIEKSKATDEKGGYNCVLLQGPTSGGKTFASMAVIDGLLARYKATTGQSTIVYCTPNFYLAIQTYSIIINTFGHTNMGLMTKGILSLPSNDDTGVRVIVGTPKELWTLLFDETIEALLIDEIHMIGNSDCNEKDKQSMSNLISIAKDQVIGLSATIHKEDLQVLGDFIKTCMGGERDLDIISYGERPVPLYDHVYDGEIREGTKGLPKFHPIDEKSTKKLLLELRDTNKRPTLIFDEDDVSCFKHYKMLVKHLEEDEKLNFPCWLKLLTINQEIRTYNAQTASAYSSYREDFNSYKQAKIKKQESDINKHALTKKSLLNHILDHIADLVNASVKLASVAGHERPMTEAEAKTMTNVKSRLGDKCVYSVSGLKGLNINIDTLQLLPYYDIYHGILKNINRQYDLCPDMISPLPEVPNTASPHLILGETKGSQDIINVVESCKANRKNDKLYNNFVEICKSERCDEDNARLLFKLLAKGLKFGVAILIESIPYVIQLKVMSLLKDREIEVVFASQSMRMGIDFPIRSCVIRADTLKSLDICSSLQMAGRAGRRRRDTVGYVYYWNIQNAADINNDNLPRLNFPKFNPEVPNLRSKLKTQGSTGFYINDYNCIIKIVTKIKNMQDLENTVDNILTKYESFRDSNARSGCVRVEYDDDGEVIEDHVEESYENDFSIRTKGKSGAGTVKNVFEDINEEQAGKFTSLFDDVIDIIAKYLILDENKIRNKAKVAVKSKILKKIIEFTVNGTSLTDLLTVNGKLSDDKISKMIDSIQEWLNIIQEIHTINRQSGVKNALKLLQLLFEILHQSKYKLTSLTL